MKAKIIFFLIIGLSFRIGAQDVYDDFYKFKSELYNKGEKEFEDFIKTYRNQIENKNLSEEESLTIQNFLVIEELTRLNKDKNSKKQAYLMLKKQNEASKVFMQGKKISQVGKWFLVSWGDIKSQYISYLSGDEMYKEAGETKSFYLAALKKDKKFSPASISYGLWLFFAPPIAGGGYENSLSEFSKAVSNAKNNYEKYLALIFRSQVYFVLEDFNSSKKDLKEASDLIPDENFTVFIEELNKNDKIFFKQ